MARYEGTFPAWGTITWLTAEQGGRASGPPATPWDTYYFATAFVPPDTVAAGLSSVVINVSNRDAWTSHAKLGWLAPPGPPLGRGSCVIVTEGPREVALFMVSHVEDPSPARAAPLTAQRLAEVEARAAAATPGPWHSRIEGAQRAADQDFLAHARADVPALAREIRDLWELLDLVQALEAWAPGTEGAGDRPEGYAEPFAVYVVQTECDDLYQRAAFTSSAEAVKALRQAQSENSDDTWVINSIPVHRRNVDYLWDR